MPNPFAGRAAPGDRFDPRLLAPMMLGAILNPVNSSIIAVALVPIGIALGAPASETAWLVSALYLATAIGQPLAGRFVDIYGPRRLFLIGAALTVLAGVVGTVAPDIWVLVAARVVLGFGTCAGYPAAMSLIRRESDRTGVASPAGVLTILSITTQTIAVVGPTLGGLLIGVGGWRSTLAVNIVLGVACLVLGWLYLPSQEPDTTPSADTPGVDSAGILLFAVTLIALLLFLMTPALSLSWLPVLAIGAGVAFAWWELRHPDPFIDVRVLAGNIPLLATYARMFTASVVSYCFIYGFTQWLEQGRGLNPATAGLVLLPTFAVGILVTALTGRRPQVRGKLIAGAVAQIVCCALLFVLGGSSPVWLLLIVVIVLGIPQGLVNLANQNALYHQARPDKIGASAGLLRTFMYLGAMVASSATGFFYGRKATTTGLHHLAWFVIALAAVFLALTLLDRGLAGVGTDEAGMRGTPTAQTTPAAAPGRQIARGTAGRQEL
ncbi:MFS transporter [Tsukamurella sp. 8F]|uniref:MFS transporter n=1 Tax=unclassified Tsukamurella TaxID=2633480 RepID=UPI0023B9E065|nr:MULTISPECIES: MFS transporter [unclassified Tsukamurella]MDF0529354.1 MFS transporter [Tsukamurella sp. 8J]MDF0587139.1 MFS transporter [Tsukamurella sp. 8F]